ncbi:Periplasmic thiol:disulfide interchange protein DsbA [Hyphomicrobium sulfonivorans]|uniref:Periplasmic thiol:disulfide interchange protein DsbA n=1 Tax=Hyphomicrobium sulfonivorans TaxID=121290 RepID=A0A109BJJ2_HYPSL|nr:DsbA family protein [Hyphomicrobium sulfonivorans]KWT69849.1 Periplasmic thiol:disulfide interchange protein DsbA [Hyphomicrobium sulfonivorans]
MSASKISSGRYMFARRAVLTAACATALGAALALPLAAQSRGPSEVPVAELMKPVGLPDLAIGPDDAKVTVVEYASMTCGHCATFTNNVWPDFKKKYIDSGKVRYVFREFPLDNLAAAASMLARCAGNDKALPMIEVLFEKQNEWAFGEGNPVPRLFEIAKQAGFTQESFDKCLTDQKLLDDITAGRTRASEVFGVSATPTFYVNGKKLEGGNTMDKFDAAIEPLLEKN